MTKRILIAYANKPLRHSLVLLKTEARYMHVFDRVIAYTEKDLSPELLASPLMQYARGGGYWAWKPYIIWKTLQEYDEGDIICYLDSGCKVHVDTEWDRYFSDMERYDTLCFQYQEYVDEWKNYYQQGSAAIRHWSKKATIDFFREKLKDDGFLDFRKIWGGAIFCKGKNNAFIKEWLDITLSHPELVSDPTEEEKADQYPDFSGYHRHDQAIITPLAYKYQQEGSLLVKPERFDINREAWIIKADRRKPTGMKYYTTLAAIHLNGIFGEKRMKKIKRLFSPKT